MSVFMNCNCTLCKARNLRCHPLEVYFEGRFEAELVRANPNLPIHVYETYASLITDEDSRKFAIQAVKDYHKVFKYREVITPSKHSLRFVLPMVTLLRWFLGIIHSHIGKMEKAFSASQKWVREEIVAKKSI